MKKKLQLVFSSIFYLIILVSPQLRAQTYIRANNPKLQYFGRIDFSDPLLPTFSWPGVSVKAKFYGSSISIVLKDYANGSAQTTNYFNLIVDGKKYGQFKASRADTLYDVVSGLEDEEHVIEVFKRTESSVGKSSFKGFIIPGNSLLDLPAKPDRKIEFIGDSWTCGYGNEIETTPATTNTGFNSKNEDNYEAWGALVARRFDAQYMCTAYSGRGLYRNNTGTTNGTLPKIYDHTIADQASPAWDHSNYSPDLILIKLGTNDFFKEDQATPDMLDSASFVSTYINFIQKIRGYHSNAKIVVAFGSSKSDYWPIGLNHFTRWTNYSEAIVNYLNNNGDANVDEFRIRTQSEPYGEDWHPSKKTHIQIADDITSFIENLMGWTSGNPDCQGTDGGGAYLDGCNTCVGGTTGNEPCVVDVAGIGKIADGEVLSLYPNPASNEVYIEGIGANARWNILDSKGRLIKSGSGDVIEVNDLITGLYFVLGDDFELKFIKK